MNDNITVPGPLLVDVAGCELDAEDRELLAHPAVGGAILFTRNFADVEQLRELTAAMRRCRPNVLVVADYEGGRVQRFRSGVTRLPTMRWLGQLWQQDRHAAQALATDLGWLMASELAALGVAMPLAPVVDLDYDQSTVIGDRALAADGQTVIVLARALMHGLREAGSVATAKHFPGHGHVVADSHAELPLDARDAAALWADMAPYQPLIADGLASVMMAHIRYPAVDELPASLSPRWIDGYLRQQLGFSGCVFCDDLSMGGAAEIGDYAQRAALALAAGCDYLPVCNNRAAVGELLDHPALAEDRGQWRREQLAARCHDTTGAPTLAQLQAQPRWQRVTAQLQTLNMKTA